MTARANAVRLSDDVAFPVDVATETLLVLGKRGSGKSNTAARLVEQLHAAGVTVVVVDPVDNWWGLQSSADGKREGLGVYVFGGRAGNIDLTPESGALVANTIAKHRCSVVLSVKHLSGAARGRFVTELAEGLLHNWQGGVLHLVLEEAHEVAPQVPMRGEERMLGAIVRLWKLGRAQGIGGTAVTQRPASLSKNVTTQSEILIAHRTMGPQDVKAVGEWVKYQGESGDVLGQLAQLPTGEAFVWAPDFPRAHPLGLVRTKIDRRTTFDSAATPRAGEQRIEPSKLADVDLERLRGAMDSVVKQAAENDPKALRARIAELERRLAKQEARVERVEVVPPAFVKARGTLLKIAERLSVAAGRLGAECEAAREAVEGLEALEHAPPAKRAAPAPARVERTQERSSPPATVNGTAVGGGKRRMLTALAQRPGGLEQGQLAIRAGMSAKSGTWRNYVAQLRSAGYVDGSSRMTITPAGLEALGAFDPLPEGPALVEHWANELGGGQARMLRELSSVYPRALTPDELGERVGITPRSGTWRNYIGRLRKLELITGSAELRASDELA